MMLFSPKNDLNYGQPVQVKLIKYGEKKPGKYGEYYPDATAEIAGAPHGWSMDVKMRQKIEDAGFKEGETFVLQKVKTKAGFDFIQIGAIGSVEMKAPAPNATNPGEPEYIKAPPKSDYGTQAGRGAAWNNAVSFVLKYPQNASLSRTPEDFAMEVSAVAEKLAPHQSKFVNQ